MAAETNYYKYPKPEEEDFYNIAQYNHTLEMIDEDMEESRQEIQKKLDKDKVLGTMEEINDTQEMGFLPDATVIKDLSAASSGHISNKLNPHGVTKSQVGLPNVDNTADSGKSVKYAASAGTAAEAFNDSGGWKIHDVLVNLDIANKARTADLNKHKASADHDSRYCSTSEFTALSNRVVAIESKIEPLRLKSELYLTVKKNLTSIGSEDNGIMFYTNRNEGGVELPPGVTWAFTTPRILAYPNIIMLELLDNDGNRWTRLLQNNVWQDYKKH